MNRLLFAQLSVAVVLLALGAGAACDNDGDSVGEDGTAPASAVTPDVTPEESDENGVADGDDDEDLKALRAEAEGLCPAEFLELCTDAYTAASRGSLEAAMCETPDGKWFFETPQGEVGDACSLAEGVIIAIVGGE